MRILTSYVLIELAKVFLIALVGLTLMMSVVGVVKVAAEHHLPLAATFRLIPYIIPDQMRVTVPVTLLLACTSVFARMSGANEVIAIKALGISPMVFLWPTYIVAFVLSLVSVWMNDVAVSWGHSGMERVVVDAVEDIILSQLQSERRYSCPYFSLNVKKVEGKTLYRVTVSLPARGDFPATTITAETAELGSDRAEGVLRIYLRHGAIDVGGKGRYTFDVYPLEIPLTDASRAKTDGKHPAYLAMRTIPDEIDRQRVAIEQYDQEMAARAAYQMLGGDFDELTSVEWTGRAGGRADKRGQLNRLLTERPRRWSAGFCCLCFVWVGAPMAIRLRNRDFLTSFFLCFLPIMVVYYPLFIYGVGGAKNGTIPPYSVWAGNILLLAWGAWLLRKVIRY
jgi:lipopolysaccharide export system permease protein